MHKFDYSFLKKDNLPGCLINIIIGIYIMNVKDTNRKERFKNIYSELEKIAKVQSTKESNAIEGIITSDERIKAIINQNSKPLNRDEQEIKGYSDALNYIHNNHENIDFDLKTINKIHKMLLENNNLLEAGKYKTEDNVIMEVLKDATRRVRFKPVPAKETKKAMEQLYLAYLDAKNDAEINRLLLIPCVILDFLCIHPYADGNGRMSRLLSLLLLYKLEFDVGKYISFEGQISIYKNYYYNALKESSNNWEDNKNDYSYFMKNFLLTLFDCYKELESRFETLDHKRINKQNRIESILANSLTPLSKNEIYEKIPDASITTIEYVLGKLLRDKKISKINKGKKTKYIVK